MSLGDVLPVEYVFPNAFGLDLGPTLFLGWFGQESLAAGHSGLFWCDSALRARFLSVSSLSFTLLFVGRGLIVAVAPSVVCSPPGNPWAFLRLVLALFHYSVGNLLPVPFREVPCIVVLGSRSGSCFLAGLVGVIRR